MKLWFRFSVPLLGNQKGFISSIFFSEIVLFEDIIACLFKNNTNQRFEIPFCSDLPTTDFIGARLVISHPQGREVLEQQKKQYQDVVTSDLPDKMTLQKAAANHSFEMVEYVDEPGFYLTVLRLSDARN